MRHRRAILAAVAVLLASSTASAVLVLSAAPPATTSNWLAELRACATSPTVSACTEKVWTAAVRADALGAFYTDLDTATREDPNLSVLCHDGGHYAGRNTVSTVDDAPALIRTAGTPSGACNNGFLHGALDKAGMLKPTVEQYGAIISACEATSGMIRTACTDGIGHSSYIATTDVGQATGICLRFTREDDRNACMAGVVMQMNRADPFTAAEPVLKSSTAIEQIDDICGAAEAAGATPRMLNACFGEGAAASVNELAALTYNLISPEGDRSDANIDALTRRWADAVNSCSTFGEYAEICGTQIAIGVTWRVGDDPGLKKRLCSQMPAREREICITTTSR
jgi:hypothetical protein